MTRISFVVVVAALVSLSMSSRVVACSCCANPGDRSESTREIDENARRDLLKLPFYISAELRGLWITIGGSAVRDFFGAEDIEGFADPSFFIYGFRADAGSAGWTFHFTNEAGKQGKIEFPLPSQRVEFSVDPRDGESGQGGGPRMYHEWRLHSPRVALGGIVGNWHNEAQAVLILQGHHNRCISAEDFSHWNLLVDGPNVRFALQGELKPPELYRVHGVVADDVLNIRNGPGTVYKVVGKIPPNGSNIYLYRCRSFADDGKWCEIDWPGGSDQGYGWVSARFLISQKAGLPPPMDN